MKKKKRFTSVSRSGHWCGGGYGGLLLGPLWDCVFETKPYFVYTTEVLLL